MNIWPLVNSHRLRLPAAVAGQIYVRARSTTATAVHRAHVLAAVVVAPRVLDARPVAVHHAVEIQARPVGEVPVSLRHLNIPQNRNKVSVNDTANIILIFHYAIWSQRSPRLVADLLAR